MEIDQDINQLLVAIESGAHSIESAIDLFLESLPGNNFRFHRERTVIKYQSCLTNSKHCFKVFMGNRGKNHTEEIKKDDIVIYKDDLLNKLDQTSVRPYITSVKQFCQYVFKLGWNSEDLSKSVPAPKVRKKELIKVVPREIVNQVLKGEWGINSFVRARNRLIVCLLLLRGLHPKEFPTLLEEHIHPYEDLAFITVYGKRDEPRDVMLDPVTFEALKVYMIERAHHLHINKMKENHIFISIVPLDGSRVPSISGVQAVVRRIKEQLKLQGCLWDLSALNPQGCRRTAVTHDYEKAEDSSAFHPEMTLCGQYGHSLPVAQKHYWRKSLKNAYRLIKDAARQDECSRNNNSTDERDFSNPPKPGMKNLFPPDSFFGDFGINI